jgi:hypothetical protein
LFLLGSHISYIKLSFPRISFSLKDKILTAGHRWLTAVILATQKAEIRRIAVQSQTRQIVHNTLSQKNPSQKRVGEVAQGVGPECKPQYRKNKVKV